VNDHGWERAAELFDQAAKRSPEERAAFLAEACGNDEALRVEVESLLAHHEQAASDFLQPPEGLAGAAGQTAAAETIEHDPSSNLDGPTPRIEGYEIVRELGRGGQAIVYQAIQKAARRKVAIKVLLEGAHASKSAQKRFEREIELIAQLRHPNIISIFHSGTTQDRRHFYVMDYVRGAPLRQYVRDRKLTLEQTLGLFAGVCEAVQHAHQKGVIHRDLKPNNILVDADGAPKVMDFGLAKLLAGPVDTLVSISQQLVGTLPYMSPEQARGNPDEVDTRTDIYALGVILYELLTGHYPYPVVGQIVEVLKHIVETPATPPSRIWSPDSGILQRSRRRSRHGRCPIDDEVQTIVLRALAKDRERRYQSAGELARDIQHYLAGEPIEAKRDSALYVLRKLARRHAPATVALLSVVAVLVSTASISIFFYRQTRVGQSKLQEAYAKSEREAEWMSNLEAVMHVFVLNSFLCEWHADRLASAKGVRDQPLLGNAPERIAMDFLLNGQVSERELLERLGPAHASLAHFAIGEREWKAGNQEAAVAAYKSSLDADPGPVLKILVEGRLGSISERKDQKEDD